MAGGGRYREVLASGSLGKMVSAKDITSLARNMADAQSNRLALLARDAVEGKLSPAMFEAAVRSELRNAYSANAALGRGGFQRMTAVEYGRNGATLRDEYQYLRGFAQDIADGKLTVAQAEARARLYGGKAYSRYTDEDARLRRESGEFTEEKWGPTRGDDQVCGDCSGFAAMGWQPLGTFPSPGDGSTACLGACRCPPLSFR